MFVEMDVCCRDLDMASAQLTNLFEKSESVIGSGLLVVDMVVAC